MATYEDYFKQVDQAHRVVYDAIQTIQPDLITRHLESALEEIDKALENADTLCQMQKVTMDQMSAKNKVKFLEDKYRVLKKLLIE